MLDRIGAEGWIERRPGYGWEFSAMMRTPDALLQSYRLRLALEPAALLEPGYRLDPAVLARCRQAEMHLLDGGIETDSADQLHDRGVRFHESLVEASGNAFFIDAIRRVNRVRRLLRTARCATARYREHCEQHLRILDLLERERNQEASDAMREHLSSTLRNIALITPPAFARRRASERAPLIRGHRPARPMNPSIALAFCPTGKLRAAINLGNPILPAWTRPAASPPASRSTWRGPMPANSASNWSWWWWMPPASRSTS